MRGQTGAGAAVFERAANRRRRLPPFDRMAARPGGVPGAGRPGAAWRQRAGPSTWPVSPCRRGPEFAPNVNALRGRKLPGFNEAGAGQPRIAGAARRLQAVRRCFNEAGAGQPRISRTPLHRISSASCFNEAGAGQPRIAQTTTFSAPVNNASMKPGLANPGSGGGGLASMKPGLANPGCPAGGTGPQRFEVLQ